VEFTRHGITTMEEANAFLWDYLPRFNEQFSLRDEKDLDTSTFLQAPAEEEINAILAVVSRRSIDPGHSIKYHNAYYQPCVQYPNGLRPRHFQQGTKALVVKAFDGSLLASIKDEIYILREVEKRSSHSKEFDPEPEPVRKERKPYKPAPDHPWKTRFLNPRVLETHIAESPKDYEL
jgi:adenylate kinase family enzyme